MTGCLKNSENEYSTWAKKCELLVYFVVCYPTWPKESTTKILLLHRLDLQHPSPLSHSGIAVPGVHPLSYDSPLAYLILSFRREMIMLYQNGSTTTKGVAWWKKNTPFRGWAVKRERRKGSSHRQHPAYGAAVNEVAHDLLRRARSPNRENGGRRYIKHDGMIASPVGSCLCCWQLPLSPPVPPLYCSAPHCPSLSLYLSLSLSDQVWCIQRCDCVNCT